MVGSRDEHPLARYRRRHKLTLVELAARVGSSQAMLSRIECGEREASVPLLRRLVAVTNGEVTIDEIINAHPPLIRTGTRRR